MGILAGPWCGAIASKVDTTKHLVVTMSDHEAYPAMAGIKCARCGEYSLAWFGPVPPLSTICQPKVIPCTTPPLA